MTLAVLNDAEVVGQLWVSLSSLILSYVAAHELGLVQGRVNTARTERRLVIETPSRMLFIDCHSGSGTWRIFESYPDSLIATGSFRIGTDSMVELSDRKGKLELDVAAEVFTAKIFDED